MKHPMIPLTILIADDDPDDQILIQNAFEECHASLDLRFVENGEQLTDYMHCRGEFADPVDAPRPDLILLDLNMPRKDGREVLAEIKSNPGLRSIPIVVLTTSRAQEDIVLSYRVGANSYITKPSQFKALVNMVDVLAAYWLKTVELPDEKNGHCYA